MPKRIGNSQTPSVTGLTDIINLKQHKNFVEQGIFPSTDNHVVNSLRFDGGSYLSRNMSGTGQAKWTFSFWVKRSADGTNYLVGESYASHDGYIEFGSNDKITMLDKYCSTIGSTYSCRTNLSTTNSVFRDFNSFYHIVCTFNSSESTVSDGFKIYVNGQLTSSNGAADLWPRNSSGWFLGTMYIGRSYSANYLRGYMAEVNFIDGQELTPTDFGYYNRSTDQWKPKKYTGTYGANGFLLEFKDLTNIGKDTSGNGNDWTSTGFVSSDYATDSPHNTFATFNPLHISTESTPDIATLSNGNLIANVSSSTCAFSNFQIPKTGKWFIEVLLDTKAYPQFGLGKTNAIGQGSQANYFGIYNNGNSLILYDTSYTNPSDGGAWSPNADNSIGLIAIDSDNNKVWLGVNTNTTAGSSAGVYIGNSTSAAFNSSYPTFSGAGGGGSYSTAFNIDDGWFVNVAGGGSSVWVLNCGQDNTFGGKLTAGTASTGDGGIGLFHTIPPSGFKALCTQNLTTPSIENPEKFFRCVDYVGDGTSTKTITVGFPADLYWIKNRDHGNPHNLWDSVRGFGSASAGNNLQSDTAGQQNQYGTYGYISSVTSTTTVMSDGTTSGAYVNKSGDKMIAWCWRAAGSPAAGGSSAAGSARVINEDAGQADTTCAAIATAVTNNGRTNVIIPNKMSINHKSGFSIVQYSGTSTDDATLPTGINDPEFTIIKNMSGGNNSNGISARWPVSLKGVTGTTKVVYLDDTQQGGLNYQGGAQTFNNDSVHIYKGTDHANGPFWRINETGSEYIMYCWKSIPGYSKFGTYEGNGAGTSANGPFVYLGFKPAFLMVKNIDDGTGGYSSWYMADSVRSVNNPAGASNTLFANEAYIEGKRGNGANIGSNNWLSIDFLSNGFKVRAESNYETNQAAKTYIYMAFAEQTINFTTAR